MWYVNNIDNSRSIFDKRCVNVDIWQRSNPRCHSFSTLDNNRWCSESEDTQTLILQFECLEEMKIFIEKMQESYHTFMTRKEK